MTDAAIDEIYVAADAALAHGQPFFRVHVFPFRMTARALSEQTGSPWYGFWTNLAEGWRWFEEKRRPPDVDVEAGRYEFGPS